LLVEVEVDITLVVEEEQEDLELMFQELPYLPQVHFLYHQHLEPIL